MTPSASVPDLRPRKGLGKILLIGGIVAFVAAASVGIVFGMRGGDDPGVMACEQIEKLAEKDPEYWDDFVTALARTVERRAWNSTKRKDIEISGDTRFERCTASFEAIRETAASYKKYETIAECVSKATSWRTGSTCFDDF